MSEHPSVGFQITSTPDRTAVEAPVPGPSERAVGGAFRLALVANLDPQAPVPDWPDGQRVWSVDADTFAERMRTHGPRLEVPVGEGPALAWTADALDAFTPAGIAARVPALAATVAARDALADAADGTLTLDALRQRLHDTGVAGADGLADAVAKRDTPANHDDGALDALLGLVDMGDARTPALDALIGAAAPSGDLDRTAARTLAERLAERLRAPLAAAIAHPDVRRAEAGWRGLKMLIGRLDFRKGARLDVLAAPKHAVAEAVHFQILLPEHAAPGAVPLAAVVVAHDVEATSADLDALVDLAGSGESLQVPVVVGAGAAFFGLDGPTDFAKLPPATAHLQRPEYATFRSLRSRPEAAFLALAVPPFLLRHAYGPDHRDPAFGIEGGDRLWGSAALLVACAMAHAHRERAWPTAAAGQAVPDLVVRQGRMGALPLATSFPDGVLADLARAGVLAFAGPLRSDRAVLGSSAMAAAPTGEQPTWGAAVLSALAGSRAVAVGEEAAGMATEDAVALVEQRFRAFFGPEGAAEDAVTVQHLEEHDTETFRMLGVRLRPPSTVLPRSVGIVFGVEVPTDGG
ncbi:type VI secretion system contractile sheath domain-containing protein [Rubrivirga sp. IMCC45206]|uniref:type VI secretion system contractile sheath domain-containing protein n=1 Tax=Rubrivirga sp. IMCC45206 TaxID=3391614 RepID=UPI0039900CDD